MPAQVVSLFRSFRSKDWTQNELAQFYRVENALIQAGLSLETERGVTDEGDPWFVFCRADNGDVFIHFARIDGEYIAVGAALEQVVHGRDFQALVEEMLAAQAFAMARSSRKSTNLFLHPAALLIALVGGAFFHSSQAKAAEQGDHAQSDGKRVVLTGLASPSTPVLIDSADTATILSGVMLTTNDPNRLVWSDIISQNLASAAAALTATSAAAADLTAMAPVHAAAAPIQDLTVSAPATPVVTASSVSPAQLDHFVLPGLATTAATTTISIDHGMPGSINLVFQTSTTFALPAAHATSTALVVQATASSDAGAALQGADVLGQAQAVSVVSPFSIETALKSVGNGVHIVVTTGDGSTLTAPADLHQTGSFIGGDGVAAGSPPDTGTSTPPPTVASSGPTTTAPPAGLTANSPQVTAALQHFSAEVGALDIANATHGIVMYDGSLFTGANAVPTLDSVTFTFADGSTIMLIGTVAEIQNLHLG